MSEENVEVIRRLYDAVARHDSETVLAVDDPEVQCDYSRVAWGPVTGRGIYRRHQGLRSVFREWREVWESYEETVEELIDAGEQVISILTVRARGGASGAEVELTGGAGVWTLRDGKIVSVVWFPTRAEGLEAAGLSE